MPTIKKKTLREKPIKWNNEKQIKNAEFYGSMSWNRLRKTLLSLQPLCYECLKHEKITPAEHCHHIIPFMSGKTDIEKWNLFLNENNIRCVCEKCHHGYHNKINRYNLKGCDDLTDKEYEEAHKIN